MPNVGEIKRGHEVGFNDNRLRIYCACEGCGIERWVQVRGNEPRNKYCRSCALIHRGRKDLDVKQVAVDSSCPDVSVLDSFFDSVYALKSKIKELESEVEFYKGRCQKLTAQILEIQKDKVG